MRVALITDGIWPYVLGGMQKHSYYLCKYLAANRVDVDLYHFNQSEYPIAELAFFSEEERRYIHSYVVDFPDPQKYPGHYLRRSYKYSKAIYQQLQPRLSTYDFIYTKGFSAWYLINQKYRGKISCAPIGINFHGYEMFQQAPNAKIKLQHLLLLRKPVKQLSQRADVVFSYGGKITPLIASIGVKHSAIFEMPSGVEEKSLNTSVKTTGKRLKLLFLGRYERRKGLEELNEALLRMQGTHQTLPFDVQFVGPLPADKQLTLAGCTYQGEVRDPALLKSLIRECDVLVCPSWSEGMPNVILEAMANGLAVIATDVGATQVLVDASTGWLIPNNDPGTLVQTFEAMLHLHPTELDQKKQAALQKITTHFVWDGLIKRFCQTFLKPIG